MVTLELKKIEKTYSQGESMVWAVNGVSLKVANGEVVLIMGPSGSGKTTLLSIAGGILRPTAGIVKINGVNVYNLSDNKLPKLRLKSVGFVFQSFNLLSSLTALENVLVPAHLARANANVFRKSAALILESLGLKDRLPAIPAKLSGGEKQRVAIARALINNPDLILADEPTANLDSKIGHEVALQLKKIAKVNGKSVVIVSHDNRIRDIADQVLWLEDGAFKSLLGQNIDPVCGMPVTETEFRVNRGDTVYFFCSRGCRDEFLTTKT